MIRVAIVEDEPAEAERLQSLLARYSREKGVQFEVQTYTSALTFLAEYNRTVDIVFMDIELPDVNGMEISRRLRKQDAAVMIVFVTNMAQFAVQGYEVAAQDFIVKPAQYGEFALKLAKALVQLDRLRYPQDRQRRPAAGARQRRPRVHLRQLGGRRRVCRGHDQRLHLRSHPRLHLEHGAGRRDGRHARPRGDDGPQPF